jgi:UDP-N-acetylglucosamine--N-acetylmuramyl-(pentapeptide) pyrophosphoryl-undecaprenol N-acetylglucosamine transferase
MIHVCGREGDIEFLEAAASRLPLDIRQRYLCFPYLHSSIEETVSMTNALGAADVVLCRSGASILGELPMLGLPAVLVPYPFVHQEENADYLVQHGAAVHIPDGAMLGPGQPSSGPLFQELQRLLREPNQRTSMARSSRDLAQPNAARQLAELLLALASRRGTA